MVEVFSNFGPRKLGPAGRGSRISLVRTPFSGDLNDTIVGGTGRFAEATGTASGTVKVAGGARRSG